jgi:hypothetical protein
MAIGAVIGAGLLFMLPMRDPDYEEAEQAPLPAGAPDRTAA